MPSNRSASYASKKMFDKALEDAEVLGRIRQLGGDVFADASQQSAGQFIAAQQALWAKLIKERHITTG